MTRHLPTLLTSLTLLGLGAGCATMPPGQLVDAREGYLRSSTGPAARWTPAEVQDGKRMLDRANTEFEANGDTVQVRDQAYLAGRQFARADSRAQLEVDRQAVADAVAAGVEVRDDQARSSQEALDGARTQLDRERLANDTATRVLQSARAAEGQERADDAARQDDERRDRAEVEARSSRSLRELSDIAHIHEDARGQVITLDAGALFAFGRATLLESARARLDRVADALRRAGDDRRMVIEGHTDGLGADAQNGPLSRDRAQAVRQHLIRRGVDPARVTAIGLGSTRPLIDNGSAANRANNRRVEIVIRPAGLTTR